MTYRDDLEAAKLRRNALARELREVRERMDELQALGDCAHQLERELDRSAEDLDRARAKVKLPLLQQVRVASPCKERWDQMTGDDRVRFCGRCEKNVYDLSALTTEQAEALLRAHGGSLCVRFYRRRDGTVMTSDCPVGRGKRRVRRTVAAGLMAAGSLSAAFYAQATMVMGRTAVVPEPLVGQAVSHEPMEIKPAEEMGRFASEVSAEPEPEALMGDVAFEKPAPPER